MNKEMNWIFTLQVIFYTEETLPQPNRIFDPINRIPGPCKWGRSLMILDCLFNWHPYGPKVFPNGTIQILYLMDQYYNLHPSLKRPNIRCSQLPNWKILGPSIYQINSPEPNLEGHTCITNSEDTRHQGSGWQPNNFSSRNTLLERIDWSLASSHQSIDS